MMSKMKGHIYPLTFQTQNEKYVVRDCSNNIPDIYQNIYLSGKFLIITQKKNMI